MKRNRVCIALSAVGIHASIGSVYAWSVLTKPVMAEMGISLSSTTWAFSIAILFLGLSAAFLGSLGGGKRLDDGAELIAQKDAVVGGVEADAVVGHAVLGLSLIHI